ncbi:MAG TPA: Gfo/Idh/MocA family oxidoreductase [Pirellulaceae bacterium]|jgi:predicted dehydrogenase|nr:Gfo/Idh/MocA family oxidoreductase [Pirellulaceae bacterium]
MPQTSRLSRRQFIQGSAAIVGAPYIIPSGVLAADGRPGANDKIRVAGIGIGRQGSGLMGQLAGQPDVQIVGIADVNLPRAEANTKKFGGQFACQDYRRILDRKDVDAIVTATPDHWRALVSIHAAQAGKDIYAEKPMTLTILEGRRMAQAAHQYERVFQTGSQQRSQAANRYGCELVRNGRIGKITKVVGFNYPSPWNCQLPAQTVPDGLDWDMWCGPTELVPYNNDIYNPRAQPGWISFRPYSGGEMTGWGAHGIDQIQWALGMDESGPTDIWVEGTAFDPPTYTESTGRGPGEKRCAQPTIHYRYANGVELILDNGNPGGGIFHGEQGKIEIFRGRVTSNPAEIVKQPIRDDEIHLYKSDDHMRNWLDCIKSRKRCIADVEIGHRSTTVCHLGNIARWLGRPLKWDPVKETFPGDKQANALIDRQRRKGYELPEVV